MNRRALSVSPQNVVVDAELALLRGDGFAEAARVHRVTGGWAQARYPRTPEFVEWTHRQFAQILGGHRGQCRRQKSLALHPKHDAHWCFFCTPLVTAFDVA